MIPTDCVSENNAADQMEKFLAMEHLSVIVQIALYKAGAIPVNMKMMFV